MNEFKKEIGETLIKTGDNYSNMKESESDLAIKKIVEDVFKEDSKFTQKQKNEILKVIERYDLKIEELNEETRVSLYSLKEELLTTKELAKEEENKYFSEILAPTYSYFQECMNDLKNGEKIDLQLLATKIENMLGKNVLTIDDIKNFTNILNQEFNVFQHDDIEYGNLLLEEIAKGNRGIL